MLTGIGDTKLSPSGSGDIESQVKNNTKEEEIKRKDLTVNKKKGHKEIAPFNVNANEPKIGMDKKQDTINNNHTLKSNEESRDLERILADKSVIKVEDEKEKKSHNSKKKKSVPESSFKTYTKKKKRYRKKFEYTSGNFNSESEKDSYIKYAIYNFDKYSKTNTNFPNSIDSKSLYDSKRERETEMILLSENL